MTKKAQLIGVVVIYGIHSLVASRLELVKNYGFSFGMGSSLGLLLIFLEIVVTGWFFWKGEGLLVMAGTSIIIDRLRFGFVRDYWQLFGSHLYNNLPDWILFGGVLLFLYKLLWKR